ncbi:hypothetical protein BJ085DRAFT_23757 [Dimargaris cristalligena]|uniref:C2H2-type domain-containing protein n=1 Tax=Dimargaris cristalligena TaxID=215637 RepID=A0A4P9ZM11_9FUNG|nr:hypothetical protein BJ085DRAFT_23757 [Dimargaris cristalligena]|eukprot:RKP34148.1 hypothetical protein BJ085DRAFT_23757 [Dimargaris cristalligena]
MGPVTGWRASGKGHRSTLGPVPLYDFQGNLWDPSNLDQWVNEDGVFYQPIKQYKQANPLICPVCQDTFTRSANRDRHMLTHIGDRSYSCPDCDRKFTRLETKYIHSAKWCSKDRDNMIKFIAVTPRKKL